MSELIKRHGKPGTIQCDQGTEFTSMAMDHWAYWNKVGLDFSRPGTPGDNARNEAFNGTVRRECLSQHYFLDITEASVVLDSWRHEYNNDRPHGSLGHVPPARFRAGWSKKDDPAGGHVTIEVYDVSGRHVRTLVNEFQDQGVKSVDWDGTDDGGTAMATGVYFYRMAGPGIEASRKMLLLK